MARRISLATLLVRDYDQALIFFVDILGFAVVEDKPLDETSKRWIVAPPSGGGGLLLALVDDDEHRTAVGRQAAGRVAFFLETDDFARDHAAFSAGGVRFTELPRREDYGMVTVFEDLYGKPLGPDRAAIMTRARAGRQGPRARCPDIASRRVP